MIYPFRSKSLQSSRRNPQIHQCAPPLAWTATPLPTRQGGRSGSTLYLLVPDQDQHFLLSNPFSYVKKKKKCAPPLALPATPLPAWQCCAPGLILFFLWSWIRIKMLYCLSHDSIPTDQSNRLFFALTRIALTS